MIITVDDETEKYDSICPYLSLLTSISVLFVRLIGRNALRMSINLILQRE
jgi:hypothetical protein